MILGLQIGLALAYATAVASSPPGSESRAVSRPAPDAAQGRPTLTEPDFKIIFWFDGVTQRHRVYDVRKGQYTKVVEDWVRRHQQQRIDEFGFLHPGTMAIVRDVSLEDEPGRTEPEKLEAGVARASRSLYAADPADLSVSCGDTPGTPDSPASRRTVATNAQCDRSRKLQAVRIVAIVVNCHPARRFAIYSKSRVHINA